MFLKLLPIWIAYFLAAATPGAAQIYIIENSFLGSVKRGRWAALGVSLGSAVWVMVVAFGLNQIVGPNSRGQLFLKIGSASLLSYFILINIKKFFSARRSTNVSTKTLRREPASRIFFKG